MWMELHLHLYCVKGLRNIGANVDYKIPHRVEDGYGINENIIDYAKK